MRFRCILGLASGVASEAKNLYNKSHQSPLLANGDINLPRTVRQHTQAGTFLINLTNAQPNPTPLARARPLLLRRSSNMQRFMNFKLHNIIMLLVPGYRVQAAESQTEGLAGHIPLSA